MRTPHTTVSRCLGAATTLLAIAEIAVLLTVDAAYIVVIVSVLTVMTVLAAAKLCRDNCVESRVVSIFIAVSAAGGVILSATLGLPGSPTRPPDLRGVVMFVLAVTILVLALIDRPQRHESVPREAPYAL